MPLKDTYSTFVFLDEKEIIRELTSAIRSADRTFETAGGSTRHYVSDCLIPELQKRGLSICRTVSRA